MHFLQAMLSGGVDTRELPPSNVHQNTPIQQASQHSLKERSQDCQQSNSQPGTGQQES